MRTTELKLNVVSEANPVASQPAVVPVEGPSISTAETAECQCPEFCERDHDLD